MFDIGFSELFLVGIIALLVVGPEKLPAIARTAGLWWGRLKYTLQSAKNDFDKEIGVADIRRQLHNEQIMKELGEGRDAAQQVMNEAKDLASQVSSPIDSLSRFSQVIPQGENDSATKSNDDNKDNNKQD